LVENTENAGLDRRSGPAFFWGCSPHRQKKQTACRKIFFDRKAQFHYSKKPGLLTGDFFFGRNDSHAMPVRTTHKKVCPLT
jgi:hypothetical protein